MSRDSSYPRDAVNRRRFLSQATSGLGLVALQDLLARESGGVAGLPHHPPKAKRVIQFFMAGAASHVDLFDYKPLLEQRDGEPWNPGKTVELFQSTPGATFKSPWQFRPYGECGKPLSEIAAPLGKVVDKLAFVHDIVGKTGVHSQGTLLQSTGFQVPGFPSAGSWVSYALGSMNDDLPTFVVLPDHRGLASNGTKNWSSMFLPATHQGTVIQPANDPPIASLFPPEDGFITPAADRAGRDVLAALNERHAATRPGDSRLTARLRSYELAGRMQLSATEALELRDEPQYIRDLYGLAPEGSAVDDSEINDRAETEFFGRRCLIARRLVERGVRFIQIWSGNDNGFPRRNWDSHEDVHRDHGPLALGMSRGISALIQDLDARGLLDDTILHWTTEFGRMPCAQRGKGRDHNPFVFTNWLAGGGIRGGVTVGESDEWGFEPADPKHATQVYDIYATMLHLLGIDHERLTVRQDGIDRRLTDVHGHVIRGLLA